MVLGGFWGVGQFSFMGGLIWGTVQMVLGSFKGVRQFSFMGLDLGHCVDGFRRFLGSYAIFLYGGSIWGTV
jgi:hypothetical protein